MCSYSLIQYVMYTFSDEVIYENFFKVRKLTSAIFVISDFYINKYLKYVFIIYVFINTIYYVYLFR